MKSRKRIIPALVLIGLCLSINLSSCKRSTCPAYSNDSDYMKRTMKNAKKKKADKRDGIFSKKMMR